MASSVDGPQGRLPGALSPRRLGLVGQTSASWGAAGGLLATMVVCGHILAGSVSSSVAFLMGTLFFAAGSVAGFLHGGLLGYLGRPDGVSRRQAVARIALSAGYAVPVLAAGWLVAMVLVLSALALRAERYAAFAAALLGWAATVPFLTWAAMETSQGLRHLLRRWPDARAVLVTLLLTLMALAPIFVIVRPEMWIVGVRPTSTAAAVMALVATVWIAGPVVVAAFLALRAVRHRPGSHDRASPTAASGNHRQSEGSVGVSPMDVG